MLGWEEGSDSFRVLPVLSEDRTQVVYLRATLKSFLYLLSFQRDLETKTKISKKSLEKDISSPLQRHNMTHFFWCL